MDSATGIAIGLAAAEPNTATIGAHKAQRLADLAVSVLVEEAMLTPKPGLVDLRSRGAHDDMNWALLCHSAWSLRSCFQGMAMAAQAITQPQALRDEIGRIGREGEASMMRATDGVNTHRGAIWALGLLVSAAAQRGVTMDIGAIAGRAALLARLPDSRAIPDASSNGQQACDRYGVGGARGQAQAGFPHVINVALPRLRRSRREGVGENAARIDALIAIIAELDDTCVLSRGGEPALHAMQSRAKNVLAAGGISQRAGQQQFHLLDRELLQGRISPGGAADLLAGCLFLDRLQTKNAA